MPLKAQHNLTYPTGRRLTRPAPSVPPDPHLAEVLAPRGYTHRGGVEYG